MDKTKKHNNKFVAAICRCDEIRDALKPGLTALGNYSVAIRAADTKLIDGSVDIDKAVKRKRPSEPRWDFAVGYSNEASFIEVHPADTKNIDEMLKKVNWLKNWLSNTAPELKSLHKSGIYYWIPSGRVKILRTSNQFRKIASNGLLIARQVDLKATS